MVLDKKFLFNCNPEIQDSLFYKKWNEYREQQILNSFGVDKQMVDGSLYCGNAIIGSIDGWELNGGTFTIKKKENDDMKLGQIVEAKDELGNIFDGEVMMLVPGYSKSDFTVKSDIDSKEVTVIVKGDDGYKKNDEYVFNLSEDYELDTLEAKVANGVFTLKATYKTEGNIEVQGE